MEFTLQRKKIKNMYLRVKKNEIVVSAPVHTPFSLIEAFVLKHESYIQKAQQQITKHDFKYQIHDRVRIFGKYYNICYDHDFKCEKDVIYIQDLQYLKKYLRQLFKKYAEHRFEMYCELLQTYFPKPILKFSYLKGKWGVCFTKKKHIALNYDLIHCHEAFIDYVILHELTHLVHPNHSKQFYYFIEKYMPNYKAIIQYEKTSA